MKFEKKIRESNLDIILYMGTIRFNRTGVRIVRHVFWKCSRIEFLKPQFFSKNPIKKWHIFGKFCWIKMCHFLIDHCISNFFLEDGTTTVVTTRDTELTSIPDGLTLAAQRTSKPKKLGASSNTIFNTFFISLLLLVLL